MLIVVGLGNPGPEYETNRHNIGFMVVDELARRWGLRGDGWRSKFGAQLQTKDEVLLMKPQEFMNVSGPPVQRVSHFYQTDATRVVVVHDDLDLDFGRLRVKVGGGHGGHNGLRSLTDSIGPAFMRVRCGIGKPIGGKEKVLGHVLGGFSKAEQKELPVLVNAAADAVQVVLAKGAQAAMNQFNAGGRT